jgi:hypothetical protein
LENKWGKWGQISTFDIKEIGKVCQVNNSLIFSGKPIGLEEFLN